MSEGAMLRPDEVRADYNRTVQDVQGDYIAFRWQASPTQRRHYAQTRLALRWAAETIQPGRLLEVGCGPAVWTSMFLPRMTDATLVDISDEMLDGARRTLGDRRDVQYVRSDFAEAALEPASFDSAGSIRAFEYMPDQPGMLARFAACLKPGGRFVLVTKNAGWQDHRDAQASARNVDPGQVDRSVRLQSGVVEWGTLGPMARAAGFREVAIHPAVIGTYRGFMRNRAALAAFDLVHRWAHRRPMTHSLDRWTESVLVLATR